MEFGPPTCVLLGLVPPTLLLLSPQAHFEHHGVNLTHQQEKLDLLATLGLDLYITGGAD